MARERSNVKGDSKYNSITVYWVTVRVRQARETKIRI
jgi:hypothetical protein